jgi:integrase
VLNAALNRAVEMQLLARNPAQVLRKRLPRIERVEMATLTPEQAEKLLTAIRATPLYSPVLIALATGMRRGEVLALRWRNIDLDRGIVRITSSLEQTSGGLRTKAPKSGRQGQ